MSQIVCDNLVKIYKVADLEVVALQGLDLVVEGGELIAIVGASGSGKSTLQNILGGLDTPTAGTARVAGFELASLTARERTIYRREVVGFVQKLRGRDLFKLPGVAETIDWTDALIQLDQVTLDPKAIDHSLGALLKYQDDIARIRGSEAARILEEVRAEMAAARH